MIPEFPDRMRRYAIGYFGADGEAWLEVFPDILTRCFEKWGLTLGPVVKEIKANYVGYAAMSSGEEVILKVGVPRFVQPEMKMLEIYDGRGINRTIDHDLDLSAMLLERFRPGTMLRELDDSREQARIAGRIIKGCIRHRLTATIRSGSGQMNWTSRSRRLRYARIWTAHAPGWIS